MNNNFITKLVDTVPAVADTLDNIWDQGKRAMMYDGAIRVGEITAYAGMKDGCHIFVLRLSAGVEVTTNPVADKKGVLFDNGYISEGYVKVSLAYSA